MENIISYLQFMSEVFTRIEMIFHKKRVISKYFENVYHENKFFGNSNETKFEVCFKFLLRFVV